MKPISLLIFILASVQAFAQSNRIIDHLHSKLDSVPLNWIDSAQAKLNIRYGHTSHGSQLTTGGMWAIRRYSDENEENYKFSPTIEENSLPLFEFTDDLSGDYNWDSLGRDYLASHPDCNVMMWAWCSIDGPENDIDDYLGRMDKLIKEYGPGGTADRPVPVTFVFMTSHSWPWSTNQLVYESNMKIRQYCIDNNYWLYDFYDLESWDPDKKYFGDGNPDGSYSGINRLRQDCSYAKTSDTRGNWGIEWMQENPQHEYTMMAADSICTSCKHSEGKDNDDNSRLQCILKGNAAWWLFARIAGWEPDSVETPVSTEPAVPYEGIHIFPNPGTGIFTVEVDLHPDKETTEYQIFDFYGKELLKNVFVGTSFNINLSLYPKGNYLIIIRKNNKEILQEKFVLI